MFSNDGFDIDSDRFLLLEPTLEETGRSTSTAAMLTLIGMLLYIFKSLSRWIGFPRMKQY